MQKDVKCSLPWIHTSIHTTGRVRSCCIAKDEIDDDGEFLDVMNHSFSKIINSSSMREIRAQMRIGIRIFKEENDGRFPTHAEMDQIATNQFAMIVDKYQYLLTAREQLPPNLNN